MADRILDEHEELHTLVNNAGIGSTLPGGGERMESDDGYELRFQVNYLAAFLLTQRLVPLLFKSAPARIVNVSSLGQMPIDFDDVMLEQRYSGVRAYCQSKLADVMLTFDLADEMPRRAVTVNCLHPASFMPTKIVLAARGSASSTLEEGVDATMRLIADPALDGVSGRYFTSGHGSRANPQAYDGDARADLRELSERVSSHACAAGLTAGDRLASLAALVGLAAVADARGHGAAASRSALGHCGSRRGATGGGRPCTS